jgi:hypothetical protein
MNNINKATPIPNRLNINSTDTNNSINGVDNVIQNEENNISVNSIDNNIINSFQAIAPLTAHEKGVNFWGSIFPSKWDLLPPFSHDTTSFKGTCLLIKRNQAKAALYGPHLCC